MTDDLATGGLVRAVVRAEQVDNGWEPLEGADGALAADPRIEAIATHFRAILDALHLDIHDPNLEGTPERVARMYLEVFAGMEEGSRPFLRTFPNGEGYSEMVAVRDIPFYSMCAHHFLPFFGHAHVAYLPGDTIVGLSKLARAVEFYARRPQVQERMTEQIIECLDSELSPQGAMVVLQGRHMCMEMRGVQKHGAITTTSAIRGAFSNRAVREEFLQLLQQKV
jgi:GTP cyclohydrolase I